MTTRNALIANLREAADRLPWVSSLTFAGSFARGSALEAVADIDVVLVVDELDAQRFAEAQQIFAAAAKDPLATAGYSLRINPTLGPLKFNDLNTAVLHLMFYTVDSHREHVIRSPFTCLDWQRSELWHKRSLADLYPTFRLRPVHFTGARRGPSDYLRDLEAGVVSYRELSFDTIDGLPTEIVRHQAMDSRARHEFAYHVMRFLMQNLFKLVRRENTPPEGEALSEAYFAIFNTGVYEFASLFSSLAKRKRDSLFEPGEPALLERITAFVHAFAEQFREDFERRAARHVVFRHAPTDLNIGVDSSVVFQGRTNIPVQEAAWPASGAKHLQSVLVDLAPARRFASPLVRTSGTWSHLASCGPKIETDQRLIEFNYGACEGLTAAEAREIYPDLFFAWSCGADPAFPSGGESTRMVKERALAFADEQWSFKQSTATCSHNGVLRCLIGEFAGVPMKDWFRIQVPHLLPVTFLATERFGIFADWNPEDERKLFTNFGMKAGDTQ